MLTTVFIFDIIIISKNESEDKNMSMNLISGCYSPDTEHCKTCLVKDYCSKTPPIIHKVNNMEILHRVINKNK